MFFVSSLRLSDHKVLHNIASSSGSSLDFARIFSLFTLVFRTSSFWGLRNLIKQLFHSRLLDMRLVIPNSALRASLAIYHLIFNARAHGIIVSYYCFFEIIGDVILTFFEMLSL